MSTALATLTSKIAQKFDMGDGSGLTNTLKATCFKGSTQVTDDQMTALLLVAQQYNLNPFTKEIYAFPDKGGIVPVVGLDGWSRIINEHKQFDGMDFEQDNESCTCIIYRKDRSHPVKVTEYMSECKRTTGPWSSHPRRMLRHKAMIQCARLAFGYVGIYEQDEAERILEAEGPKLNLQGRNPQAAATANAPAGADEYEQANLPAMREAAMNGSEALAAAFAALPKGPHKAGFWATHKAALKLASEGATVIDAETGEVMA